MVLKSTSFSVGGSQGVKPRSSIAQRNIFGKRSFKLTCVTCRYVRRSRTALIDPETRLIRHATLLNKPLDLPPPRNLPAVVWWTPSPQDRKKGSTKPVQHATPLNLRTLLTLTATLQLQGKSPTYILNEDTHPAIRAIGVSHPA